MSLGAKHQVQNAVPGARLQTERRDGEVSGYFIAAPDGRSLSGMRNSAQSAWLAAACQLVERGTGGTA